MQAPKIIFEKIEKNILNQVILHTKLEILQNVGYFFFDFSKMILEASKMFWDLTQAQKNIYLKILAILFTTSELHSNLYMAWITIMQNFSVPNVPKEVVKIAVQLTRCK